MSSRPTVSPATFPVSRPPPTIGTGWGSAPPPTPPPENNSPPPPRPAPARRPAHREAPGVLQEKRPLLRKEQIESREVDLLLVHLHLREVRVIREIQRDAGCNTDLGVGPERDPGDGRISQVEAAGKAITAPRNRAR